MTTISPVLYLHAFRHAINVFGSEPPCFVGQEQDDFCRCLTYAHLLISIMFSICQCFSLTPSTNIRNRHISYHSPFLHLHIHSRPRKNTKTDTCILGRYMQSFFPRPPRRPKKQNRHITQWKHQNNPNQTQKQCKKKSQETKRKCK